MTDGNETITAFIKPKFIQGGGEVFNGLTKREYFAALAMQGLMSNAGAANQRDGTPHTYDTLAETSTKAADALINALNKQP